MKQRLINFLLHHVVNATTLSDVITADKSGVYIDGKKVTEDEMRQLKAEVKALTGFRVWHLMTQTLKEDAYKRGLVTSTSMEHVNTSKSMIYNLGVQQSIIDIIKKRE